MSHLFQLTFLLSVAFSLGCQTNEIKAFSSLQPGMDKGQVISIMGSPQVSDRIHGRDRWTYVFYHDELKHVKEVQFTEGKSTYIGDPPAPEVSATEQDAKNAAANKELETAARDLREQNRQGSFRDDSSQSQNQIRYVPEFKPIQ
jgi:outer membrane protein assembly factor BamE